MDAARCTFDIAQVGRAFETGSRMMEVNAIPYFEGLIKHNWARDTRPGFSSPTFLGLKESLGLDDMD